MSISPDHPEPFRIILEKNMFNVNEKMWQPWIYFLTLTKTGDNLIQNRDTLASLNAEVVFILRVVAVQYDVPGEDSDDDD